jgi:hypothetical protein
MTGKNQIIEAIQEGVRKAQRNYNEAASSLLLYAPEYFMDVHIFQAIYKVTGADSLTMEHNNRDLLKDNPPRGRKIKELRKRAKLDIIIWYPGTASVRGFIEVKKYAIDCKKDVSRICYMVKNEGRFGLLVSGIHQRYDISKYENRQNAEKKLIDRISRIETNVKSLVDSCSGGSCTVKLYPYEVLKIPLEVENNKSWIWSPICFLVEIKR